MNRVFFEEKQKLPSWAGWIVVLVSLGGSYPLLRMLYLQTIMEEPAQPDAPTGFVLLLIILGMIIAMGVAVWLVFSIYLEVKIDDEGIYYRYFPHHRHPRKIDKRAIAGHEIRPVTFSERMQARRGRRLGQHGNKQVLTMGGSSVLVLKLIMKPNELLLGTGNPEGLKWAMRKLLSPSS